MASLVTTIPIGVGRASAEGLEIPIERHGWGRFESGAWQTARIVTETIDAHGEVVGTTTTDRRTELVRVRRNGVKLRVSATVTAYGKRFDTPVQTVIQGLHGENVGDRVVAKVLKDQIANVNGEKIRCQVHLYRIPQDEQEKVVKVFYSPRVSPYIFRRETVTLLGPDRKTTDQSNAHVVAIAQPYTVLDETVQTSHYRIEQKTDKGSTVTVAIHAPDIPGEVVAYTSSELDDTGRLIRRSRMELLDYDFEEAKGSDGKDVRRKSRRDRRRSRRDP